MTTSTPDLAAERLALAGIREFTLPGAGQARRGRVTTWHRQRLADLWRAALAGRPSDGLALAAVGSVGRGDPGPLSDLDLVLLHSGRTILPSGRTVGAEEVPALADRLWYPLWDAGLRLDHSVRTATECRNIAKADLAAAVGLLDLSHVAGDPDIVAAARSTVAHDWRSESRKRLPLVLDALTERHRRHGDLAQSLEPDLKEARGGLRDLTLLRALAEAWLADRPHGEVDAAYGHLLDVRDALHVTTGRARDRLTRDDADPVAALLGFADADDLLTSVSRAARIIGYAVDGTVRRAAQSQRARSLRIGPRRPTLTPLGRGMHAHDGELVLGEKALRALGNDPLLPLHAARIAARAGLPIAPTTLRNLASIPAPRTPWDEPARTAFTDLLAAGPGLLVVWEGLDQAGIIDSWLPEWAAVRSRPQRSAVHRHTVDRHLLETVVRAGGHVREVSRPDLLLVAALLHDIGKVAGAHDHSAEGAPTAAGMAARLGFAPAEVAVVERLVREHLTLIDLATRRDHADPATLEAASVAAGEDPDVLELLIALTVADASAAGPQAWSTWRARLFWQLADAVRGSLAAPGPQARVADAPLAGLVPRERGVSLHGSGTAWVLTIVEPDRDGLFADTAGMLALERLVVRSAVVRTVDGVAANEWHVESREGDVPDVHRITATLARLASGDRAPLARLTRRAGAAVPGEARGIPARPAADAPTRALLLPQASGTATVLEVRAGDRPGLLHDIGRAIASEGVSIRSAHIATYAGQTLDTFYLTTGEGDRLAPSHVGRLIGVLLDACDS